MENRKKRLLIWAVALVVAIGAAAAWIVLLLNEDDALTLNEDGRLSGFTMTRLVARFSKGGGEEKYYKVADVSQ